jgi:hypothetical protein
MARGAWYIFVEGPHQFDFIAKTRKRGEADRIARVVGDNVVVDYSVKVQWIGEADASRLALDDQIARNLKRGQSGEGSGVAWAAKVADGLLRDSDPSPMLTARRSDGGHSGEKPLMVLAREVAKLTSQSGKSILESPFETRQRELAARFEAMQQKLEKGRRELAEDEPKQILDSDRHSDTSPIYPTASDLAIAAGISDDTFRRVRKAARIEVKLKGAAARNRRYSPQEVDRLIRAAIAGTFLERRSIAEKWARWGSDKAADKPHARK